MLSASQFNGILAGHGFLTNASYNGVAIKAHFRNRYVESLEFQGTIPIATCLDSDIIGIERGHSIIIADVLYKVMEIYPESNGWTALKLEKQ